MHTVSYLVRLLSVVLGEQLLITTVLFLLAYEPLSAFVIYDLLISFTFMLSYKHNPSFKTVFCWRPQSASQISVVTGKRPFHMAQNPALTCCTEIDTITVI